jgi:DNA primase
MRAVPGTRLGLIPHPAAEPAAHILLVEGPPDMLAARSAGLPAIAVPGARAWQPAWATFFESRRVTIVMDCDTDGRDAAPQIAASLTPVATSVQVAELAPDRTDGYDLTNRIIERRRLRAHVGRSAG